MTSVRSVIDRLNIPWAAGAFLTSPSRRLFLSPVGLALLGGTLLVVLLMLVDWTAELLWFRALGYADVFWRLLFCRNRDVPNRLHSSIRLCAAQSPGSSQACRPREFAAR